MTFGLNTRPDLTWTNDLHDIIHTPAKYTKRYRGIQLATRINTGTCGETKLFPVKLSLRNGSPCPHTLVAVKTYLPAPFSPSMK